MRLILSFGSLVLLSGGLLIGAVVALVYRNLFTSLPRTPPGPGDTALANAIAKVVARYPQLVPVLVLQKGNAVAMQSQLRNETAKQLVESSWILLGGLALFSVVAGGWIAGRVVRRLSWVTEAARRASEATLHERLSLPGPPDELTELGDTFNAMLERLDTAFGAQRRFAANVSHELRTPLAVTRTVVEVTLAKPDPTVEQLRAMGTEVHQAAIRAERLIAALLALARSESAVQQAETDDLADMAMEALDAVSDEIARHGLAVTTDLAPAPVHGDIALLSRTVANLVENAVRHNVSEGRVHVVTRAGTPPAGPGAVLEVSNTGPVMPPGTSPGCSSRSSGPSGPGWTATGSGSACPSSARLPPRTGPRSAPAPGQTAG